MRRPSGRFAPSRLHRRGAPHPAARRDDFRNFLRRAGIQALERRHAERLHAHGRRLFDALRLPRLPGGEGLVHAQREAHLPQERAHRQPPAGRARRAGRRHARAGVPRLPEHEGDGLQLRAVHRHAGDAAPARLLRPARPYGVPGDVRLVVSCRLAPRAPSFPRLDALRDEARPQPPLAHDLGRDQRDAAGRLHRRRARHAARDAQFGRSAPRARRARGTTSSTASPAPTGASAPSPTPAA